MIEHVGSRLLELLVTVVVLTVLSFACVKLFNEERVLNHLSAIPEIGPRFVESVKRDYRLGRPVAVQYLTWLCHLAEGEWGYSVGFDRPIREMAVPSLGLSFAIYVPLFLVATGLSSATATYVVWSAGRFDAHISRLLLACRNMPALVSVLVLMFVPARFLGFNPQRLFSPAYLEAPWSMHRLVDLGGHLLVPALVLCVAQVAHFLAVVRGQVAQFDVCYPFTDRMLSGSRSLWRSQLGAILPVLVDVTRKTLPWFISTAALLSTVSWWPTTGSVLSWAAATGDPRLVGVAFLSLSVSCAVGLFLFDELALWLRPHGRSAF
jgi:peptide/nickel transport system permease protein